MFANNEVRNCPAHAAGQPGRRGQHRPHRLVDAVRPLPGQQPPGRLRGPAIDYASRFETSPPTWTPLARQRRARQQGLRRRHAHRIASAPCSTTAIEPQLQRLLALAPERQASRGSNSAASQAVTPEGCALLLHALHAAARRRTRADRCRRRGTGRDRARRRWSSASATRREAPWLLLLELLQLMNREKDFEEAAMDYCVTYELSPPQFEAPANVANAAAARAAVPLGPLHAAGPDRRRRRRPCSAPSTPTPPSHAASCWTARAWRRIDYAAATALHERLRALAAQGRDHRVARHEPPGRGPV